MMLGRRYFSVMSVVGLLDIIEELDRNIEDRVGVYIERFLIILGGNIEYRVSVFIE